MVAAAAASAGAPASAASPPKPLVVVGSVNADLVLPVARVPAPGETLAAAGLSFFPGGKGANQAAAAARLGYPTYFVGATGTDANAAPLRAALAGCGVRLDYLRETDGPSGTAVILLQPSGDNSIVIVGGANQDARSWQLSAPAEALIARAGGVLLQREIPEEANARVAALAAEAGVPVVLDAGGADAPLSEALLARVSLLSPNETELARLVGGGAPAGDAQQAEAAARALMARSGVPQVLVKLGADGSLLVGGGSGGSGGGGGGSGGSGSGGSAPRTLRQACVPAPQVVDTTGAGDCFTAAFAVATLEGMAPERALLFASAAASLCVRKAGAMPSMPSREEVDALLATL